jgi:hypothetical protein
LRPACDEGPGLERHLVADRAGHPRAGGRGDGQRAAAAGIGAGHLADPTDALGTVEEYDHFYAVQIARTLFDEWALIAEWGRIGSSGKVRHFKRKRWPGWL